MNEKPRQGTPETGWLWMESKAIDQLPEIGQLAFCVYGVLARYANNETSVCFPSVSTIAKTCCSSRNRIRVALAKLEEHGFVTIKRGQDERGANQTNRYTLLVLPEGVGTSRTQGGSDRDPGVGPSGTHGGYQMDPLTRLRELDSSELESAHTSKGVPPKLLELIDGWNSYPRRTVVFSHTGRDPPADGVLKGWRRVHKNREPRPHFADIPAVIAAIGKAKGAHGKSWFTLPSMLGKNGNEEWKICKLMNGEYDEKYGRNGQARQSGAGQEFDEHAEADF